MMFGWCMDGDHDNCKRETQRFVVDPKTNKTTMLDEHLTCACPKRGCKCYIKKADRKPVKRKK